MSILVKVLLVLGALGGLSVLVCAGGAFYVYSQFQFDIEEDPDKAVAITAEIADIDIAEGFEPQGAVVTDMVFMQMKLVDYEYADTDSWMLIAELDSPMGSQRELERELRQSLEDEGWADDELRVVSTENRDFEIRDSTATFQFAHAKDRQSGEPFRQVSGSFPARDRGVAFLTLAVEEANYDEDGIIAMIESIR